MHAMLGYLLCLFAIPPALSLEIFCWFLGRTTRQHDVLGLFRSMLQTLATVSSPSKLGLTMLVLLFAFAAEAPRSTRGIGLLIVSLIGLGCSLHLLLFTRGGGGGAVMMLPSTAATLLSVALGSRLLESSTSACGC